jgi:hypothetical protein
MFEGFTVGKAADAIALAESAGIDTSTLSATNSGAALVLGSLLGFTVEGTNANLAIGLLDEPLVSGVRPGAHLRSAFNGARLVIGPYHFEYSTPPSVMLYRAVVPEPLSLLLMLTGAAGLLNCRPPRSARTWCCYYMQQGGVYHAKILSS